MFIRMLTQAAIFFVLAMMSLGAMTAADIEGTILVKRKLTKRTVTANVTWYQRGVAVPLTAREDEDALSFERAHVVLYLEGDLPANAVQATMDQKNRRFIPDLLAVPTGSTVLFPNGDPIFHNVFSLSRPKAFDLGNYPKGQSRSVTFSKAGIVFVNCHLHPNMGATIVVSPNQWVTKADAQGRFVLRNVPPGKYTIVAWHKSAGFFRQIIQVDEDHGATVQFLIPFESDGTKAPARS
ncbi:MAG: hypothetical protein ACRD7E_21200 [Bryobacteraceae bacterium]